jgi:diphthamide synthase (EF-2-diphthine--ammonia ligase)
MRHCQRLVFRISKEKHEIDAVSVGAIFSEYQNNRVANMYEPSRMTVVYSVSSVG